MRPERRVRRAGVDRPEVPRRRSARRERYVPDETGAGTVVEGRFQLDPNIGGDDHFRAVSLAASAVDLPGPTRA